MKSPLGRLNCVHCMMKLPSWSNIWMRLLLRSATNSRPWESMASACGVSNSPRRRPFPAPALDDFAVARELDDPGIGVAAVSVSHEDVAARRDQDRGRGVEHVHPVTGNARPAQRHAHLAVGRELEDLL